MQTVLSSQLQEATHLLIENLVASEVFIHYQRAQAQLNADSEAHALLNQLSQAQADLRKKQVNGGINQARVQCNPVIIDYAQSQQEAITFLREINDEISQLLGTNFATFANHATC